MPVLVLVRTSNNQDEEAAGLARWAILSPLIISHLISGRRGRQARPGGRCRARRPVGMARIARSRRGVGPPPRAGRSAPRARPPSVPAALHRRPHSELTAWILIVVIQSRLLSVGKSCLQLATSYLLLAT